MLLLGVLGAKPPGGFQGVALIFSSWPFLSGWVASAMIRARIQQEF